MPYWMSSISRTNRALLTMLPGRLPAGSTRHRPHLGSLAPQTMPSLVSRSSRGSRAVDNPDRQPNYRPDRRSAHQPTTLRRTGRPIRSEPYPGDVSGSSGSVLIRPGGMPSSQDQLGQRTIGGPIPGQIAIRPHASSGEATTRATNALRQQLRHLAPFVAVGLRVRLVNPGGRACS